MVSKVEREETLLVGDREVRTKSFIARKQTATQDYECDDCGLTIPDETEYVRAVDEPRYVSGLLSHPIRKQPGLVEMFHVECWNGTVEHDVHRL
jgi:hypothetical protein